MRLLLLILALLVSPIGMAGGAASAQPVARSGHCAAMEMPADDHQKPVQTIDCMSICSAVAPSELLVPPKPSMTRAIDEMLPAHVLIGAAPERETPPPRSS